MQVLSTEDLCALFEELSRSGVKEILITGGEPLLHRDFSVLINKIADLEMAISLFTNGTFMDQETARTLALANATVNFSIDGGNKTHDKIRGVEGAFKKAMEGIHYLLQARRELGTKNRVQISCTVQRHNLDDIIPCFNLAKEQGLDAIWYNIIHGKQYLSLTEKDHHSLKNNISRLNNLSNSAKPHVVIGEMLREFTRDRISRESLDKGLPTLNLFKDDPIPCLAVYRSSFIDAFGRVFPCCYAYFDNFSYHKFEAKRQQFCLGNVLDSSFNQIWQGQKYDEFRAKTDPVPVKELGFVCGQCYDYFLFKKAHRLYRLLEKTHLIR
jgi:MoaA/NifB/PqqE/SkfB family radical SAM enzyme